VQKIKFGLQAKDYYNVYMIYLKEWRKRIVTGHIISKCGGQSLMIARTETSNFFYLYVILWTIHLLIITHKLFFDILLDRAFIITFNCPLVIIFFIAFLISESSIYFIFIILRRTIILKKWKKRHTKTPSLLVEEKSQRFASG